MKRGNKTFSVLERQKEIEYIENMAKSGKILKDVDDKGLLFEEKEPFEATAVIEYFQKEKKSEAFYENQGLKLIKAHKGSKGYWLYYLGPYVADLQLRDDDYPELIDTLSRRHEIFWTIIPMTLAVFGLYMYINTKNPIFFIIVILPIILIFYLRNIKKDINEQKKNNERR